MKTVMEMILRLQSTSGSNDKKIILEEYKDDESVKKYLVYVYDEVNYVYGKSSLPKNLVSESEELVDIDDGEDAFYKLINDMSTRKIVGKEADKEINSFIIQNHPFYQNLLLYILKRDIKASVGAKLINKVVPKLILIWPYQRCESESYMKKRIVYQTDGDNHGAMAQSKADGSFLNVVVSPEVGNVSATTRYGREAQTSIFLNTLSNIPTLMDFDEDWVIHGELLIKNPDGTIMERAKGNGKINKFNKRNSTWKEMQNKLDKAKTSKACEKIEKEMDEAHAEWLYISKNLVYEVWDILPYENWMSLEYSVDTLTRFNTIMDCVAKYNDYIEKAGTNINNCELRIIDHEIVFDEEQAMEFYQKQLDAGLEGMVIKNLDATWEHDTNRQGIIKLKDFKENDLIIVGVKMADPDSAFAGGIGALIVESSDGIIHTNVSGMKRHERGLERVDPNDSSKGLKIIDGFDFEQFTGKVAAVKYNEMSCNKQGSYDLFLANVLEIRDASDKSFPDDFEKIKKEAKFKG